jgi:hypothetical protein
MLDLQYLADCTAAQYWMKEMCFQCQSREERDTNQSDIVARFTTRIYGQPSIDHLLNSAFLNLPGVPSFDQQSQISGSRASSNFWPRTVPGTAIYAWTHSAGPWRSPLEGPCAWDQNNWYRRSNRDEVSSGCRQSQKNPAEPKHATSIRGKSTTCGRADISNDLLPQRLYPHFCSYLFQLRANHRP